MFFKIVFSRRSFWDFLWRLFCRWSFRLFRFRLLLRFSYSSIVSNWVLRWKCFFRHSFSMWKFLSQCVQCLIIFIFEAITTSMITTFTFILTRFLTMFWNRCMTKFKMCLRMSLVLKDSWFWKYDSKYALWFELKLKWKQ